VLVLGFLTGFVHLFLDGPPPGFTGGFGEPTCQQCHFGNGLNDPSGALALLGADVGYDPGGTLSLTVRLSSPQLAVGGFQMSVRDVDGKSTGLLQSTDSRTKLVSDTTGVQYLEHTYLGAEQLGQPSGIAEWNVLLRLPLDAPDTLVINVAGNAANGDNSALGDYIYSTEVRVPQLP
jgi:hypothetical protein